MKLLPARDLVIAFASGLLLAVSLPLPDFSIVAWFALVPLLLVGSRRPFLSGYVAGFGFFAAALYWLNIVMVTYGRLPLALSVLAYLLLVSYLSLYFAFPLWLTGRFRRRLGLPIYLTLPLLWIVFEFLRGVVLTGFPWALIGYSQHANLSLIQSADLVGVYGIAGLIVFANCLIAHLVRLLWRGDVTPLSWRTVALFLLLFAANWGYGSWRLGQNQGAIEAPTRVGLIQGNIDQALKWNPRYQLATVQNYLSLSEQAVADGADFLIWPESATPFYLQDPSSLSQGVRNLVTKTGRFLLTGSPAYEQDASGTRYLNSVYLLSPEDERLRRSDKVHLVPFGEYVPMSKLLPFVKKMVAGIGDFSPGTIEPIRMNGESLGALICYEAIFPELSRDYVKAGSGLLVNVTNDAWFGESSAPYQHLSMTRFRAIENRRWLVRSANTGISAIIAPSGRIVSSSGLFQKEVVVGDIAFRSDLTLYTLYGDLLPLGSLLLCLFWLVRSRKKSA